MPRYLHLLRHAQSADKQTGQTDKERTLTPVGLAEARAVGIFFKEKSLIPELIITSSALRAKSTSQIVAEILNYNSEKIVVEDELYEATVSTFFQTLTRLDQHINRVLIVGHNPVISFFADHLSNQQNSFLTAEILTLKSDASSWKDLQKSNTEIAERYHPIV
jgi:phosphohistidine phosphatase